MQDGNFPGESAHNVDFFGDVMVSRRRRFVVGFSVGGLVDHVAGASCPPRGHDAPGSGSNAAASVGGGRANVRLADDNAMDVVRVALSDIVFIHVVEAFGTAARDGARDGDVVVFDGAVAVFDDAVAVFDDVVAVVEAAMDTVEGAIATTDGTLADAEASFAVSHDGSSPCFCSGVWSGRLVTLPSVGSRAMNVPSLQPNCGGRALKHWTLITPLRFVRDVLHAIVLPATAVAILTGGTLGALLPLAFLRSVGAPEALGGVVAIAGGVAGIAGAAFAGCVRPSARRAWVRTASDGVTSARQSSSDGPAYVGSTSEGDPRKLASMLRR